MKAFYSQINIRPEESYGISHNFFSDFKGHWHYHAELELHYVMKGDGVRFIGDNVSHFSAGDLVLLGEHLPHSWQYNYKCIGDCNEPQMETIALQFRKDCLGPYINNLPETYELNILYQKAKRGMVINGSAKTALIGLMKQMLNAKGLHRIILLLSALKIMAENQDHEFITLAEHRFFPAENNDLHRLDQICNFTLTNFRRNISLKEVAASSNLNETSFCRYFKLVTKKSYSSFLIQIRVSQACRQLIEDRHSINAICYDCGFNNVSNFYRHFKKATGMTPAEYKQKYHKNYFRRVAS